MKANPSLLQQHLEYLKLPFVQNHHGELAQQAAQHQWDHVEYLRRIMEGEYNERRQRVIERRIKAARFPVLKTLEQFRWDWPKKINRMAVQDLFRMEFLKEKSNVVLLGNVGLGKTHLATALGYAACQQGASVLFANAISVINDLSAAQKRGLLKRQLKTYLRPELVIFPSTNTAPICSSKSSASATNKAPSS
jgi:DNA replication protein DnaC